MNGWIAIDKALHGKPEISRIARTLKISREDAVVGCFLVWAWADDQTDNGFIDGATLADIDYHARYEGFGQAMLDARWLVQDDVGLMFPNFDRWNSESAKKRLKASERKRRERDKKRDKKRDKSVTEA